jgi:hypothetical protein
LQQLSGNAGSLMQNCSSFPATPEVLCKIAAVFRQRRKFHAKLQRFSGNAVSRTRNLRGFLAIVCNVNKISICTPVNFFFYLSFSANQIIFMPTTTFFVWYK